MTSGNNITDHPYALQTWEGLFPFLLPGPFKDKEADADVLLRIKAPKSYWLYLESQNAEQVEILRRDLNGSNGLPPLSESFQLRVRKQLGTLKKSFLDTDWRVKGKFKDESMYVSIKRHDFLPGTSMEFPRYITPPPRYGPRPPSSVMKDHFPNCLPIDEEEEEEFARAAAAAAAAAAASLLHRQTRNPFSDQSGALGDGYNVGGIGGVGDPFDLNHLHNPHSFLNPISVTSTMMSTMTATTTTPPSSPHSNRHQLQQRLHHQPHRRFDDDLPREGRMSSASPPLTSSTTTASTTTPPPTSSSMSSNGEVPLIGCESVAETRIKTEFGCPVPDYRPFNMRTTIGEGNTNMDVAMSVPCPY